MKLQGLTHLLATASVAVLLVAACALFTLGTKAQSGRRLDQQTPPAQPPRTRRVFPEDDPPPVEVPATSSSPQPMASPKPAPTPGLGPDSAAASGAESKPEPLEESGDIIRVNSSLVPLPASVLDEQGRAITDLELKDFELRVDGQPKALAELSRSDSPVFMALLFDNSSSLTPARQFEKRAATHFFRRVMRPIDEAAVYSVSTFVTLEQPLTSDTSLLVHTIENFGKPEGATALFDALAQAAAYLRPHQGRRVIVIVSDGADTISDLSFEKTLERVIASDCQIYAVQTGASENANLRDLAAERRLLEFAEQTGGAVYVPKETKDLETAFSQIAADLAQQYVLSYYPSGEKRDGRFRTVSLRVLGHPNARVRTRKGYYAPKA